MPGLPLAEFNRQPATHIVSLGAYCATAHNIRRVFGIETAYCFDWWVTPLPALPRFFENPDAEALYRADELTPVMNDAGVPVLVNPRYGIEYFHEFKLDGTGGTPRLLDDLAVALPKARERTAALVARLLALDAPGNRIAFIRTAFPRDVAEDAEALAIRLAAALGLRFGQADWTVVMGNQREVAWRLPPGFAALRFHATQAADWRGHPPDWDRFLDATGIRLSGAG